MIRNDAPIKYGDMITCQWLDDYLVIATSRTNIHSLSWPSTSVATVDEIQGHPWVKLRSAPMEMVSSASVVV
jgi:hypothetical protein